MNNAVNYITPKVISYDVRLFSVILDGSPLVFEGSTESNSQGLY